jgi:hypothetical protein
MRSPLASSATSSPAPSALSSPRRSALPPPPFHGHSVALATTQHVRVLTQTGRLQAMEEHGTSSVVGLPVPQPRDRGTRDQLGVTRITPPARPLCALADGVPASCRSGRGGGRRKFDQVDQRDRPDGSVEGATPGQAPRPFGSRE